MGIYEGDSLSEQSIYGSSRLGIQIASSRQGSRSLGGKRYELANHLGNVLAVVTDNIHMDQDSTWAQVSSLTGYYPFGLAMEGRSYQDTASYRYGFNGMERDDEWKGEGAIYTTEFRQYDARIGRWMSVDPLMSKMPEWSPYNFGFNNPMKFVDQDGLRPVDTFKQEKDGTYTRIDTKGGKNFHTFNNNNKTVTYLDLSKNVAVTVDMLNKNNIISAKHINKQKSGIITESNYSNGIMDIGTIGDIDGYVNTDLLDLLGKNFPSGGFMEKIANKLNVWLSFTSEFNEVNTNNKINKTDNSKKEDGYSNVHRKSDTTYISGSGGLNSDRTVNVKMLVDGDTINYQTKDMNESIKLRDKTNGKWTK